MQEPNGMTMKMKKYLLPILVASAALFFSCTETDLSGVNDRIDDLEGRVSKLEA